VAAAALLPLRRAIFVAAALLAILAYLSRRLLGDAPWTAMSPLTAACGFLVVLLIRHLSEQRRQARALLAAERTAARAQARAAADAERTRIARDLHDSLTHHLSALFLHAQTAQAQLADGIIDDARCRMGSTVDLARRCLVEARDVVTMLRTENANLDSLRDIATNWAAATGRRVHVSIPTGSAPVDGVRLGATVAVLREALTNITRHSTSTDVTVTFSTDDRELCLVVTDTGPDPATRRTHQDSGGHGLIGLRERAALLGGTVRAGAYRDGWQVVLAIPSNSEPDSAGSRP
jgi:signal transduction histidine kinase